MRRSSHGRLGHFLAHSRPVVTRWSGGCLTELGIRPRPRRLSRLAFEYRFSCYGGDELRATPQRDFSLRFGTLRRRTRIPERAAREGERELRSRFRSETPRCAEHPQSAREGQKHASERQTVSYTLLKASHSVFACLTHDTCAHSSAPVSAADVAVGVDADPDRIQPDHQDREGAEGPVRRNLRGQAEGLVVPARQSG